MEIKGAQKIEWKNIDLIYAYKTNSRTHSKEQIIQIANSIKEFGFTNPILISEDGEIIAGHGRLEAARSLKMNEIPVIVLGYLTKEQRRALVIADNQIALNAGWDVDVLKAELEELVNYEYDIKKLGFSDDELKKLIDYGQSENFGDDEYIPEMPVNSITKRGDIWMLGKHRLLCGDATEKKDLEKLMEDKLADLVITDPPYNVGYEGKTKKRLTIQNDSMEKDVFYVFLFKMYQNLFYKMKGGAGVYIFHADTEGANFRNAMIDAGLKLSLCCVWVKQQFVFGRNDYHWQHEPILYGWKPSGSHKWYSDRKQTTVWNFDRPHRSTDHPTMKPVDLISYAIKNSSKKNDLVLDVFGGSGSTLIACEKMNRVCAMMELDERYCDVIIQRWEIFTGKKAERIKL